MSTWPTSRFATGVLSTLAVALGAAAAEGSEPVAPPAGDAAQTGIVRERAQAYWQARLEHSPRVYDFYAPPAKGGAPVSEGTHVGLTGFEIEAAEVRGEEATVVIRAQAALHASASARQTRSVRFRETWERVDGIWYRRPVPPGFARGAGFPAARVAQQSEVEENQK